MQNNTYYHFLQTRFEATKKYALDLETEIQKMKINRFDGWLAAALELVVIAILFYQFWNLEALCQMPN